MTTGSTGVPVHDNRIASGRRRTAPGSHHTATKSGPAAADVIPDQAMEGPGNTDITEDIMRIRTRDPPAAEATGSIPSTLNTA